MKRAGRALARRYGHAQPVIGVGASGYIEGHHRYAVVGLVPKRAGGGHLKTRHVVGRGRDAHEALTELLRLRAEQRASGSYGQGRWTYIVLDLSAKKGKLAPTVTEDELRARQARGE